jgi:L-lactate dehydrogenase (cytochrome)
MASPNLSSSPVISLDRVREHKFSNDCWIVVHSKVYDVTSFLPEHPGGSKIILKYAGSDATTAYDEIHAPGILEETLPQDRFVGMLSLEDVETLSAATKGAVTDTDKISKDITSTRPATTLEPYTKPELHKLISAHDFEEVAKHTFTTKAFAFYSSAATDLVTHGWNSDFYRKIMIRPRVLRNVKNVQIKRKILGCDSEAPFFVSPAAMARLAHPDGECSLAKGCAGEGIIQIVSSVSWQSETSILIVKHTDIIECVIPTWGDNVVWLTQSALLSPALRKFRPVEDLRSPQKSPRNWY